MELKEIRYILAIQQYGSITKAAESLFITQSALSKFLKNTEQQIGTPLFSRIGNEMVPTHIGRRYLDYSSRIGAILEDWETEYTDLSGETKGELTVAIPPMRGACVIPGIMQKFHRKYPEVDINLMEEAFAVEKRFTTYPHIDLALYNDTVPSSGLVSEELAREEVVLVMKKGHSCAGKGVMRPGCRHPWLNLSLVQHEPLVLHPPEQTTGKIAARLLAQANIQKPNVVLQTRNSEIAIRMAAAGAAMCFVPESYILRGNFPAPLVCFSVGEPKAETTLYAVYQKGRYLSRYARFFLQLVQNFMLSVLESSDI